MFNENDYHHNLTTRANDSNVRTENYFNFFFFIFGITKLWNSLLTDIRRAGLNNDGYNSVFNS